MTVQDDQLDARERGFLDLVEHRVLPGRHVEAVHQKADPQLVFPRLGHPRTPGPRLCRPFDRFSSRSRLLSRPFSLQGEAPSARMTEGEWIYEPGESSAGE